MKIEIEKPHPDYPLVYVHVGVTTNTEREDLGDILAQNHITLLGRWQPHIRDGYIEGVKAPALLEDEHVKPRKTTPKKSQPRNLSVKHIKP